MIYILSLFRRHYQNLSSIGAHKYTSHVTVHECRHSSELSQVCGITGHIFFEVDASNILIYTLSYPSHTIFSPADKWSVAGVQASIIITFSLELMDLVGPSYSAQNAPGHFI